MSVVSSIHKKPRFDSLRRPAAPPEPMLHSKSDLLRMILDNENKTTVLQAQSPVINVTEAIYGTYKTNFEMQPKDPNKVGLPLGSINDGQKVGKDVASDGSLILGGRTSRNSIQYLPNEDTIPHTLTSNSKK